MKFLRTTKILFSSFLILLVTIASAQNLNFKNHSYTWPTEKLDSSNETSMFSDEDIVIISERVKLNLIDEFAKKLTKNCILKINTEKGAAKLASLVLPESFDESADKSLVLQGALSNVKSPFVYKFKINYFAARVQKKNGTVKECIPVIETKKVYWLENNGNHLKDFDYDFHLSGLEIGDVVEYTYQIEFAGSYGSNLFYFNNSFPKQNMEVEVDCFAVAQFENYDLVCNINIDEACCKKKDTLLGVNKRKLQYNYKFQNLKSINYFSNSCVGKKLPHISIDLNFVVSDISGVGVKEVVLHPTRGPRFEWLFQVENNAKDAIYDKQYANVRKFIAPFPKYQLESSDFLYALNTNLNRLDFISAESMNYNQNAQYTVRSSEWLNKGKLIEEFMKPLYNQILEEAKVPFNIICLQDKRLGEHKRDYRAEFKYERYFYAIPVENNLFYLPFREHGLKYHVNELPFYYEGVLAALLYTNYEAMGIKKSDPSVVGSNFRFIKTTTSTEDQNVRMENAVFKINLDSNIIDASIKQNLIGQFSTIIRPLYLDKIIDSTVNAVYFKKCITKPNAHNAKVSLSSKSELFPFKYNFNCTEKIDVQNSAEIPLQDWFSFTFNKKMIVEKPNFDYYFDFKYTDVYNYMLEFNKPTTILNADDFTKSINNKWFELSSQVIKQNENQYLLSVSVKVKESVLPQSNGQNLLDLVNSLDELNSLTLKLK